MASAARLAPVPETPQGRGLPTVCIRRGGRVSNLSFSDSSITKTEVGFYISEDYDSHPDAGYDAAALPQVSRISCSNITGDVYGQAHSPAPPRPSVALRTPPPRPPSSPVGWLTFPPLRLL